MARGVAGRSHAPAPRTIAAWQKKWDANGSIAPQMPAFCETFPLEKPQPDKITFFPRPDSGRSCPQTRVSAWNLMGCHEIRAGISSVKRALAVPQTGSALHHLVTAVSVKKTLMGHLEDPGVFCGNYSLQRPANPGKKPSDAFCTHSAKMRRRDTAAHCDIVKE
jgi:hypothetical protein